MFGIFLLVLRLHADVADAVGEEYACIPMPPLDIVVVPCGADQDCKEKWLFVQRKPNS